MSKHLVDPAEFIADLYFCKSNMLPSTQLDRSRIDPIEFLKLSWLNLIIARLTDKYQVDYHDVERALRDKRLPHD